MKISIRFEGLKELEKALQELPKATGRNVIKRALTAAATPIKTEAALLAPVRLGHLKKSVIVGPVRLTTKNAGKTAFAEAMASGASRAEAGAAAREANAAGGESITSGVVAVGPGRNPQATLQEFGTAHHAPQPYMRPAWDTNKMLALETIRSALAEEIEKARVRLARKTARLAAKNST